MRNGTLTATIKDDGLNTELEIKSEGIKGSDAMNIAESLVLEVARNHGSTPFAVLSDMVDSIQEKINENKKG